MIAITNEQAAQAFQNANPNLAQAIESIARRGGTPLVAWRLVLWYTGSMLLANLAAEACKWYQETRDVS